MAPSTTRLMAQRSDDPEFDRLISQAKEHASPCPFCGQKVDITPWHGGGPHKVMLACKGSGGADEQEGIKDCPVGPMIAADTPREAVRIWNTRA